jgi:hypothetical protein
MEDEIVLTADGVGSGQFYQWFIPEELGDIQGSATGTSVTVNTLGVNGSYTVGVLAYNEGCGVSDTITETVTIADNNISVNYVDPPFDIYMVSGATSATTQAKLFRNGIFVTDIQVFGNMVLITDVDNSTDSTLVVDATLNAGCTVRIMKGAELPTNSLLKSINAPMQLSQQFTTQQFAIVSPNPVSNMLTIDIQKAITAPVSVYVLDMNAQVVTNRSFNSPNIQIDASSWNSGSYVVIVQSGQDVHRQVVIKQ